MKFAARTVVLILLATIVPVAQQLPAGTILPVALSSAVRADRAKVGQRVSGKLGQYVEIDQLRLQRGTEVTGRIVEVQPGSKGSLARVTLVFDTVHVKGRDIPVTTSLRALASMWAVFEAQLPMNTIDDHGSTVRDWNTTQVGGQAVYRGDGTVMEGPEVVGKASSVGEVFGEPKTWPWLPCTRDLTTKTVQSFWVFSTDACGVYGFDGLKLTHAGRSEPVGQIALESPGKLRLQAGSGLLLLVLSSGQPRTEEHSNSRQPTLSGSIRAATQR